MPASDFAIQFTTTAPQSADLWIVAGFENPPPDKDQKPSLAPNPELATLEGLVGAPLQALLHDEQFSGGHGKSVYVNPAALGLGRGRALVVGFGERSRLKTHRIEGAVSKALRGALKLEKTVVIAVLVPADFDAAARGRFCLAVSGAIQLFSYRSRESRKPHPTIDALVFVEAGAATLPEKLAAELGAIFRARSRAMDLVNMPANTKRTDSLVAEATELRALGVEVKVIDDPEWIKTNMPCFFTVARGSLASDPPKWIHCIYRPPGSVRRKAAVVGKSVIFDTGGYQVKPDDYMNSMKADMTGGATALAAIRAIAELRHPDLELHVFCAATPNKIDSDAMIPDSIVDTTCGKKVEIRHTDAEGRLTLIDAVTMAEREKPEVIITIATLTGSAARAVGAGIALMSRQNDWRQRFADAAENVGDPCFALDVVQEDFEDIESKLDGADISNVQKGKNRGAQTAAAFVMSGVAEEQPLIHLDIAGGDMTEDDRATGIAVKATLRFLLDL